jgi:hypothetical protein
MPGLKQPAGERVPEAVRREVKGQLRQLQYSGERFSNATFIHPISGGVNEDPGRHLLPAPTQFLLFPLHLKPPEPIGQLLAHIHGAPIARNTASCSRVNALISYWRLAAGATNRRARPSLSAGLARITPSSTAAFSIARRVVHRIVCQSIGVRPSGVSYGGYRYAADRDLSHEQRANESLRTCFRS